MDVLLHVSSPAGAAMATSLGRALTARGARWACFFTHDGVKGLADPALRETVEGAARAVVCEHSWTLHMKEADCPVERGSQTINSALMAEARRVVSL